MQDQISSFTRSVPSSPTLVLTKDMQASREPYSRAQRANEDDTSSDTMIALRPTVSLVESIPGASVLSGRQLRQVMSELCAALRSSLDDERGSAEECLQRAAEILRGVEGPVAAATASAKGGLCPWQIRKVTSYVDAQLDRPIRNENLAAVVRLNACHFGRAFRNSFGEPPHEYVIRRRIERAQGLMLSTTASLATIALECGLADQAHLSRLFRRVVGESPSAWRRARVTAPD